MIDKNEVVAFFDSLAPTWDAEMIISDLIVKTILDNAGVRKGSTVLDVACGTGVLVPYYFDREVSSVTGIDISPAMIEIARSKFPASPVEFICEDAETWKSGNKFDSIVIYNAFPHFSDPEILFENLSSMLAGGGVLTVAHGMSREKINAHHSGSAMHVSNGLPCADDLAELMGRYLEVCTIFSDSNMYQVCGVKK